MIGLGHKEESREEPEQEAAKPGLPRLDPEDGARIAWVEFARGDKLRLRLNTGSMQAPFEAMNQCIGNLVTHQGLDLAQQRRRTSRPDWVNRDAVVRRIQARYPAEALRNGNRARLNMRIMIGPDGKPTACIITHVTTADNFDNSACQQVMSLARFEPARNAEGQPRPTTRPGSFTLSAE